MRILATSLFLTVVALSAAAGAAPARARAAFASTRVDGGAGSAIAVAGWQIQSTDKAQEGGAEISAAGFSTRDWYPVSGRATVMQGAVHLVLFAAFLFLAVIP